MQRWKKRKDIYRNPSCCLKELRDRISVYINKKKAKKRETFFDEFSTLSTGFSTGKKKKPLATTWFLGGFY